MQPTEPIQVFGDITEELASRMIPVCSARDAMRMIERYVTAPLPTETQVALCRAVLMKWEQCGGNR